MGNCCENEKEQFCFKSCPYSEEMHTLDNDLIQVEGELQNKINEDRQYLFGKKLCHLTKTEDGCVVFCDCPYIRKFGRFIDGQIVFCKHV